MESGHSVLYERSHMLLAVETSGTQGSVAISNGSNVLAERILQTGGHRHAQSLVSEVDLLLKEQNLRPADIRSVAVSIGPGSFTGLRVGLVFAKTFAWLNQTQLVAVDTLRAIAQQAGNEHLKVTAVIDAQRGEVFAGTYCRDASSGYQQLQGRIGVAAAEVLPTDHPLTGPGLDRIKSVLDARYQLLEAPLWQPRASTVASLGYEMVLRQEFSTPESLEPVYIRLSYAEEKRDQAVPKLV